MTVSAALNNNSDNAVSATIVANDASRSESGATYLLTEGGSFILTEGGDKLIVAASGGNNLIANDSPTSASLVAASSVTAASLVVNNVIPTAATLNV